eukprot:g3446.t1
MTTKSSLVASPPQHRTGDIRNSYVTLESIVRKIKYPAADALLMATAAVVKGDPRPLLPILHFAALDYSSQVGRKISKEGIHLGGCTDAVFVERFFRVLRRAFGYVPRLTAAQFLKKSGFAELKILLVADVATLCRRVHLESCRRHGHGKNCAVPSISRKGDVKSARKIGDVRVKITASDGPFRKKKSNQGAAGEEEESRDDLKRCIPKAKRNLRKKSLPRRTSCKKTTRGHSKNRKKEDVSSRVQELRRNLRGLASEVDCKLDVEPAILKTSTTTKDPNLVAALQALVGQFDAFRCSIQSSLGEMERRMQRIESVTAASNLDRRCGHRETAAGNTRAVFDPTRQEETDPVLPTARMINRANRSEKKMSTATRTIADKENAVTLAAPEEVGSLDALIANISHRFAKSEALLE